MSFFAKLLSSFFKSILCIVRLLSTFIG
jgi:hypothetical protein